MYLSLLIMQPFLFTRASFMTKTVQYQNELHKFLIWDTAGQERVSNIRRGFGLAFYFFGWIHVCFGFEGTDSDGKAHQFDFAYSKII